MKCPICKGEMEKNKDIMKEDNIDFEVYKCKKCGEELMNMEQLHNLAKKYRKLRKAEEVTFAKWGNSIAIRIPKQFINSLHIRQGEQGLLLQEDKELKIIPQLKK